MRTLLQWGRVLMNAETGIAKRDVANGKGFNGAAFS